ncbi:HIT family protein [Imbroritus primus]|uniref:HIT family protein n=1 Tax=Imbroritus primus TaxID=3058603 RepID=A0ACD3SM55_9BURK|nr:HIT family protein [Burkholderiaceae bacterium PBA]
MNEPKVINEPTVVKGCELCEQDGGEVIWRHPLARVILVEEEHFPGFCRVVWNDHVAEIGDLSDEDRDWLMRVVVTVERAIREVLQPQKVNIASLGNLVPHIHWHVIPRDPWDSYFPDPPWGKTPRRNADIGLQAARRAQLPQLTALLQERLAAL